MIECTNRNSVNKAIVSHAEHQKQLNLQNPGDEGGIPLSFEDLPSDRTSSSGSKPLRAAVKLSSAHRTKRNDDLSTDRVSSYRSQTLNVQNYANETLDGHVSEVKYA